MMVYCVQIAKHESMLNIRASKPPETKNGALIFSDESGTPIAQFHLGHIVGWWAKESAVKP